MNDDDVPNDEVASRSQDTKLAEDKVSKLTRLVSLAKKKIEDLQGKLSDRNHEIDQLRTQLDATVQAQQLGAAQLQQKTDENAKLKALATRAKDEIERLEEKLSELSPSDGSPSSGGVPENVVLRVEHDGVSWCLAEIHDQPGHVEWIQEGEVYERLQTNELPFNLPGFSLSQSQIDGLDEEARNAKEELVKLQNRYHRYRVRSECLTNQRNTEIARLEEQLLQYKQHNIVDDDMQSELTASRKRLEELSEKQMQSEAELRTVLSENQDLRTKLSESDEMVKQWRWRCEKGSLPEAESGSRQSHVGQQQFDKLKREYENYRTRAVKIVEEKEKEINNLKVQLQEGGTGTAETSSRRDSGLPPPAPTGNAADAREARSESASSRRLHASSSASSLLNMSRRKSSSVGIDMAYLKNIVLKYMAAGNEPDTREHMEAAIATVLRFTPAEISYVQSQRTSGTPWTKFKLWG